MLNTAIQSIQNIARVVDHFLREAPLEEVKRFRPLWKKVEKKGLRQTHRGQYTAEWKWLMSLMLWDAYQSGHQQKALDDLHDWIRIDCAFFLRQWWVSELIASWLQKEEREQIRRLFEGRRGKRQHHNTVETFLRNQHIVMTIENYLLDHGYREACRKTAAALKKQRVTPLIGEAAIRRIYEHMPPLDPIRDANIYFAVKTLCASGLSEEEAEHEVATHPKKHRLRGPLSAALVHQICRRYATTHRGRRG